MCWRVVLACLALTGGVMLRAGVLPDPDECALDWRTVVLRQILNITPEDFVALRSKVLADRFVRAADPTAELPDRPVDEAIAALRTRLRLPDSGSHLRLALGDRLWEKYVRTGDMGAGQEAVKWWQRWAEAATAEPTRPLHLAKRLAELELWEAAVPMLRRAAGRCPPESVGHLRQVTGMFRNFQLEVEAEFAETAAGIADQETLMRAVVAWEIGSKDLARRLLARVRRLPASHRAIELRLRAESSGVENDVQALRALIVAAERTTPADPAWDAEAARALASALGKQRAALVDGAVARLREGSAFAGDFDYTLAAACAGMERRAEDAAYIVSQLTKRSKISRQPAASLSFLLAEAASEQESVSAWSAAFKSLPASAALDLVDAVMTAMLRNGSPEKMQPLFESSLEDVKRGLVDKTPATLGRIALWCLIAGRSHDAEKLFQEALGKSDRLDDRLALAYGLAVARQQNGDEDAAVRTFGQLRQDRVNALLLALLVESSSPAKPDSAPEENLLPKALQLARAEDCEEQARRVAKWLQLEPRWRAPDHAGDLLSLITRKSDVVAAIEKARREWPLLKMPGGSGHVDDAVRDHLAELEPLLRDMTEQRAQTAPVLLTKFNLAIELSSMGSDWESPASAWGRKLLWSVFDDARALDEIRRKAIDVRKGTPKPGSLECGIWRHRFGEWRESFYMLALSRGGKSAWTTPLEEAADSRQRFSSGREGLPESIMLGIQDMVLKSIQRRLQNGQRDPRAVDDFRKELTRRLDAAKAGYDERLTMLTAAGFGREAFEMAQDQLSDGLLTLEQAVHTLTSLNAAWSLQDSDFQSTSRKLGEFKVSLGRWTLERIDQWPEGKKVQWASFLTGHIGNPQQLPEYAERLRKLQSLRTKAFETAPASPDPIDGWLFDLKAAEKRPGALDQLERSLRNGAQLSAEQCKVLADLALNWLLGNPVMARVYSSGMPAGLRPSMSLAPLDPDASARALVLCSTALAKEEWRAESDNNPGGVTSWNVGESSWLPAGSDALPITRFLPPHFLLAAARAENVSPGGVSDTTRLAYAHEWRYQTVVRWLDDQARARKSPDDIPFRLLSLQLRWTGGERRDAAFRSKDWFGLSPYPDLRFVACVLLQRANYDREAVTLAFGLLGSNAFPADRVMAVLTESLSKLSAEEREVSIGRLGEHDAMKALLTSAAVARLSTAGTRPAAARLGVSAYRPERFPMPGSSNEVARDRRFLEQLRYDGRQACAMLWEALGETGMGRSEMSGGVPPGEQRAIRWARQLQAAHWLEVAGRLHEEPQQTGGSANRAHTDTRHFLPPNLADWPVAKGLFFDLLRACEPAGANPVWQTRVIPGTLKPPFWFRAARHENQAGHAVFRFGVSEDGSAWREIESVRWPHLGEIVSVGVANLSDGPLPYEGWKFAGFEKPDPYYWTWSKGETTAGRLPACRYQHPNEPLRDSGTLSKIAGGNLQEAGDTFSGLTRQVLGTGTMTVKLEAPPPGGRAGVFVQKDWFAGGARIMLTVDAAGKLEITQRLGQTDALNVWKFLDANRASDARVVLLQRQYLQTLVDLHHDDEAWQLVADLPDKDLVPLLTGGGAGVLAAIHAARPGKAPIFADRLLEIGRLRPDDQMIRGALEIALRTLSAELPGTTDQDRARKTATESFLADCAAAAARMQASRGPGLPYPQGFNSFPMPGVTPGLGQGHIRGANPYQQIRVAPDPPLSPAMAIEALAEASRESTPRAIANGVAGTGTRLVATTYNPETGLTFDLVQKCLSLRGNPEAAKAYELFPLEFTDLAGPPQDFASRAGVPAGILALYQRNRFRLSLGLHLALGDAEVAKALPASLATLRSEPFRIASHPISQALASCLRAGGFEEEAIETQRALLKEITTPFSPCWDYSFDVPLRLAIWSREKSARCEALDEFVAIVRRQKRAAPYDAVFRLAIRKGAELLRKDRRDEEARELEQVAGAEY